MLGLWINRGRVRAQHVLDGARSQGLAHDPTSDPDTLRLAGISGREISRIMIEHARHENT